MSGYGISGYSLVFNPNTSLPVRQPVLAVATSNIPNLSGGAPLNVDGVNLSVGTRVLVQGQSIAWQNGIYVVQDAGIGSNGTWVRSDDFNTNEDIFDGIEVRVTEGTSNADTLWVLTTPNPIVCNTTPLTFVKQSGSGASAINVYDEGALIGAFNSINFVGVDVQAASVGGIATVYVPPPPPITYASHWNTADGDDGNQAVADSTARTSAFIAAPTLEGNPFATGGWVGTVQAATRSTSATYTTPGLCTGFGGNAHVQVDLYDADGVSVLASFTSPSLAGNGTVTNPNATIAVTLTGYQANNNRFMAKMAVVVDFSTILTAAGRQGGKVNVSITMFTDTNTDGTGPYPYTSEPAFLDVGPTPPTMTGPLALEPTAGQAVTKRLSGLTFYTNGSQFTLTSNNIGSLNSNTARVSGNLNIGAPEAGIDTFDQSPLPGGAGTSFFAGWNSYYNLGNISYLKWDATLNKSNFRRATTTAATQALARDTWGATGSTLSPFIPVLIDTYGTTSTNLVENFDDEARRQTSTFNNGNSAGNWNSAATLQAGEAQVFLGRLIVPSASKLTNGAANANWTSFNPSGNPDYTNLGAPASFYRTMVDTSGLDRASLQIIFTGTFVTSATADLAANLMVIRVRRVASSNGGNSGPTCAPLYLSGALYDFAQFDDGLTNGQIREASSSGNTVNGTFGGFACNGGVYIEIQIADARISIDSYTVVFF
jgi:hypothetical protein